MNGNDEELTVALGKIDELTRNTKELRQEVASEKYWRRWAVRILAILAAFYIVAGVVAVVVLTSTNRLAEQIRDCADPQGECAQRVMAEQNRNRAEIAARSNEVVEEAIRNIVDKVTANVTQRIDELEARLTSTTTTTPSRQSPTATTPRTTHTTRRNATPPTTQSSKSPQPTITAPTTTTTIPPSLLCALLRIGCR